MKSASRITSALLGMYAGLLGAVHGYFEIRQGNIAPDGVMINAIGPPCQPEAVAHACFPAMTLIPNFLITGMFAVIVGLTVAAWAVAFVQRKRGGLVLMALAVMLLLVGGGFIPMFIGLMASFAGSRINAPLSQWPARRSKTSARFLAKLWPWPLVAYFLWVFPIQWALGYVFPRFLLNMSMALFFCFDLGLPLLAVLVAWMYDII